MTSRDLLTALGIGHNATLIIPYLMISPATTDPKASQIILLVRALQRMLFSMGASDVANTGYLDQPTADALASVVGENWERMTWGANLSAVVAAQQSGMSFKGRQSRPPLPSGSPVAVGGPLDFLPDVPGGLVTYGILAFVLYRHFTKKRAS